MPLRHFKEMGAPPETTAQCQAGEVEQSLEPKGASTMKITTVGVELAKKMFQVRGVDVRGDVLDNNPRSPYVFRL